MIVLASLLSYMRFNIISLLLPFPVTQNKKKDIKVMLNELTRMVVYLTVRDTNSLQLLENELNYAWPLTSEQVRYNFGG